MFQLMKEAQVQKKIREIEPIKHIWLSGRGITYLTIQKDTFSQQGWPDVKQNILFAHTSFWPYRDELY